MELTGKMGLAGLGVLRLVQPNAASGRRDLPRKRNLPRRIEKVADRCILTLLGTQKWEYR